MIKTHNRKIILHTGVSSTDSSRSYLEFEHNAVIPSTFQDENLPSLSTQRVIFYSFVLYEDLYKNICTKSC